MKQVKITFKKSSEQGQPYVVAKLDPEIKNINLGEKLYSIKPPSCYEGFRFQGATEEPNGYFCWTFNLAETDLERLEVLLQTYDWTHAYSDSYTVHMAGEAHKHRIQVLIDKIGPEGKALYEQYAKANE